MPKCKGFTLIELLVVLTIIAILSAIALVSYRQIIQQAEDSQRLSDLKFIQSGLEQYHGDQHFYPEAGLGDCPPTSDGKLYFGCPLKNPIGNKTYLIKIPKGLSDEVEYSYVAKPDGCSGQNCSTYCLYAAVTNQANASLIDQCGNVTGYNLELTRP